jgi:hypothetical protein
MALDVAERSPHQARRVNGEGEDDEAPDSGPRLGSAILNNIPDVRDGLTRVERLVLVTLAETQAERRGRNVPTAMLYGRVVEKVDLSEAEFMRILQRLIGTHLPK